MTRAVTGYSRPLPVPQKDGCSDGKGAVTSWVTRPICSLVTYACKTAVQQQEAAKASKAKPTKNQTRKGRTKGQKPRGVFRVWVPGWHTHSQHFVHPTSEVPCEISAATFWQFQFPPNSHRLSIHFDRFSVIFNHFQSISISLISSISISLTGHRNKHVKIGHVKIDRPHFRFP